MYPVHLCGHCPKRHRNLNTNSWRESLIISSINREQGGKLDVHDNRGRTPLHWAASEGHSDCTLLIIKKGADVNAKTQAGTTALHWVAVQVQCLAFLFAVPLFMADPEVWGIPASKHRL